jgi:hypothetical protein
VAGVPAAAFGVMAALRAAGKDGRPHGAAVVLPAAAAALVLGPVVVLLPSILGARAVPVTALLVALLLGPAVAAAEQPGPAARAGLAALAAAALLAAVQALRPHASAEAPEQLTFTFHEDTGGARWLAEAEHDGALPPAVRAFAPFTTRRAAPFPWAPLRPAFAAPAPRAGLPPPRAEVLSAQAGNGVRRVRVRLSSPRGAPAVALFLPATVRVRHATVDGVPVPDPPRLARWFFGGYHTLACLTTGLGGVTVELLVEGEGPVPAFVADRSAGLPSSGRPLDAARPATAVPSWDGDSTVGTAEVRL